MHQKLLISILAFWIVLSFSNCSSGGSDDSAAAAVLLSSSSGDSCPEPSTFLVDTTETVSNGSSCTTKIASDVPTWIQNNFHCMTIYTCGTDIVFETNDLPPFKSGYYSGSSSSYVANNFPTTATSGACCYGTSVSPTEDHFANPNNIKSQSVVFKIPATSTYMSSTQSTPYGPVGVSIWGIVFYNNQAAPGDVLATEYATMDYQNGHPDSRGMYHWHTDPWPITGSQNAQTSESALIGIAMDGYPVYGKKTQASSYPTLDSNTNTATCSPSENSSAGYCYYVQNASYDSAYVFGLYFRGSKGSVTY
ncbi:YHYH protein [Leptospira langatensis]|uniref:YHYH protein n=1 Tax=Leptospira langatensis TaxID=2484983 RepID=A0A5F1ZU16_9LEPT|nr:YHYH protein [Leptospira langatensis]TGJ98973.1 YHYH protein [Leptospira langatensis]TGL40459.1 YHYH protein [Leptospira langatensis]